MRIAIVSRESYPLHTGGEIGGIGRYTEMTARGLADQGAEVQVIAQNTTNAMLEQEINGVRVVYLPKWEDTRSWSWRERTMETALLKTGLGAALWAGASDKNRRARMVSRYLAGCDRQERSFDIVEFPECAAEGFYYARRAGRTVCVTRVHGPTCMLCELNKVPVTPSLRLLMWAERQTVAASDHVTAPSRFAADQAMSSWKLGSKTPWVVPNMLDTEMFVPSTVEEKRQGPPIIFFSGRLERRKGLMAFPEVLMRLLALGVDFECRLAGRDTTTAPMGGSMRDWLLGNCSPEVGERLVFLGQLDRRHLVRELQGASVGLFLSSYETFGYTVLEAQACGLPVVTTRLGGTGEVTRDGETGILVDPCDTEAVADALAALLRDPARRATMGRMARTHAEKEYSLGAVSPKILDLYQSWATRA